VQFARTIWPQSIAGQIRTLLVLSVVLGAVLTAALAAYLYRDLETGGYREALAAARAARIATVVRKTERAHSNAEIAAVLATARLARIDVEDIPIAQASASPPGHWHSAYVVQSIEDQLVQTWGITPLMRGDASDASKSIVIDIGAGRALAFQAVAPVAAEWSIAAGAVLIITVMIFGMFFLSLYAVRWVTAPLSSIAAAARAFGHAPTQGQALSEEGAREIVQVASALNEMRERIRLLVEERMRMLLAISHDLRTPLTRLRLRAERIPDPGLRDAMMNDLVAVTEMLGETLAFLRDGGRSESPRRVDLPSLLRTICGEFTDIGHNVSYEGPARLPFVCRDRALARAVTNVVENATKHGKVISVALDVSSPDCLIIDVSDDGPGIPVELREKVLQPFYKIDPARQDPAGRAGFGLGLAITQDVVRAHGGDIALAGNDRGGLTVQLRLAASVAVPQRA
jgi:signal transduction histidine kinase